MGTRGVWVGVAALGAVAACAAAARSSRSEPAASAATVIVAGDVRDEGRVAVVEDDGGALEGGAPSPDGGAPSLDGGAILGDAGPFVCGCALCAPVLSDDACVTDADCAPATPCHAEKCVARRKAKPRSPGLVCTMEIRCNTADVNRCGCLEGRCALYPPGSR